MTKVDVYKNGEFERYENVSWVVLQKRGILEIFQEDEVIIFQPEEFDWFEVR